MAVTSSPSAARALRFVLIVGFGAKRYPGGNIAVPRGTDARAFATAKAVELMGEGQWVLWSDGPRPVIFPVRDVQRIEVEYLDGY